MVYLSLLAVLAAALYARRCRAAVRRVRATAERDVAYLTARVAGLESDLVSLERDLTSGTDRQALAALEALARGGYGPSFTQCAIVTNEGADLYKGPGRQAFAEAIIRAAARRLTR